MELSEQEKAFFAVWHEIRQQGMKLNFRLAHEQGMSATQFTMLGLIERGQKEGVCTVSWLARQMDLDPATVVRSVDVVEKRGFVQRRRDTRDRRQVFVELTDEGRAIQHSIQQHVTARLLAQFRSVSDEQRSGLVEGLQAFLAQGREDANKK